MESPAPTSRVFEYEFTREDYIRWIEAVERDAHYDTFHVYARARMRWVLMLILVPGVYAYFIIESWSHVLLHDVPVLTRLLFVTGAGVAGACWYALASLRNLTRTAFNARRSASADTDMARRMQGPVRVTLTPALLSACFRDFTMSHRWSNVCRVTPEDTLVRFALHGGMELAVPRRAIGDIDAVNRFVETCKAYIAAGPSSRRDEVCELLVDRNFACPGCGYHLIGMRVDQCPECARPIIASEILASMR